MDEAFHLSETQFFQIKSCPLARGNPLAVFFFDSAGIILTGPSISL